MGTRVRKGLACLLVLLGALTAAAEQLPVKTYTIADGLARDSVNDIRQDSHGFLWFCTVEGISRFDGYSFTNYGTSDGLPHRVVNTFVETTKGEYLFGTDSGFVEFNPDGRDANGSIFTPITLANHDIAIFTLAADPDGSAWVGSSDGLFKITKSDGQWRQEFIDLGPGQNDKFGGIQGLMLDRQGTLWAGSGVGLFRRFSDGRVEHYTKENGLPDNGLTDIVQDQAGRIWVATAAGLVRLVDDPRPNENIAARVYTTKDGLGHDFMDSLYVSSDGRLWVGSRGGLNVLVDAENKNGAAFRSYTGNGIPNIRVTSISGDSDNNLWVGAENGGARKIPLSGFTSYFESEGLTNGRINQVFADVNGNNYVLSSDPGSFLPTITRFDGRELVKQRLTMPPKTTISWGWNQQVVQDETGDLWLGTSQGVYRFAGSRSSPNLDNLPVKAHYTVDDGIDDNYIFRLFEDSNGDIWFSTIGPKSVSCFHRLDKKTGKIRFYTPEEIGRPPSAATAFANGPDGELWMGFYTGGILRYKDGQFTHFTEKDGVPPDFIRHLFFDSKKRLWIGTSRGGVARVDNPGADKLQFVTYTRSDGLSSNQVTTVAEDRWGQIYLGTGRGIDRLTIDDGVLRKIKHYTIADGLADNFINVSFCDAQGVLWFGTLHGLSRLVPQQDETHAPPPIMISGLSVTGEKQKLSEFGVSNADIQELGYTQNQLQIDFLSISYAAGDSLLYQYRFENGDWSQPSQQRTVTLANLSPGSYRFLVRAVNSDGVASAEPASVGFKILSPIWRRWWFIALVWLVVGALAIGFYLYRTSQLRTINVALTEAKLAEMNLRIAREERLMELEKVRTRIATDLHDDIGASLTQIAILSEVAQAQTDKGNGGGVAPLAKITEVSNELVGTMSDIVWSINPAKDHVSDLTQRMRRFAADILTLRSIRFHYQGSAEAADIVVKSNLRREVFLIFKESINNIVKHANAKNVWTEVDVVFGKLTVIIRDDGSGFDPDAAMIKEKGNGLASMRRRTIEIGGDFELTSKPGGPTEIKFAFPVENLSATFS